MTLSPTRARSLGLAAVAVAVRLLHLLQVAPTPLFVYHREFRDSDMFLIDQWAQRIAAGDFLGRAPYQPVAAWQLLIGPESAWHDWYGGALTFYKAPFYAYFLAAVHRLWGDPMLPAALLQIAAAAVSVVVLFRLGARLLDEAAGFWAALLFALYAPAIHFDVVLLRGPWIVLFSLVASLALARLRDRPGPARAAAAGVAVGLALIVNEGFGPVPLVVLALILAWWGITRRAGVVAFGFVLGLLAALTPVVMRNLAVGAPALRLAVTGSTVFAVFNGAHANPYAFDVRPRPVAALIAQGHGDTFATAVASLQSFPSAGALAAFYLKKASGLAIPFENPDNVNYYYALTVDPWLRALPAYGTVLCLAVVGAVVLGRRVRSLAPLAPVAATLVASILMTLALSRYRVTLVPFLCVPAGFALARLSGLARERRWRGVLGLAVALALVSAASSGVERAVLGPRASADRQRYRPAEFFIGADVYARRGRTEAALAELAELVRRNGDPSVKTAALLATARLELKRGDAARARAALELAALASPGDAQALTAKGDLERAGLGDPRAAAASYRAALALAPGEPLASALRERLSGVEAPGTVLRP